jgi:tetratricopeptide (TPR) repeat protein
MTTTPTTTRRRTNPVSLLLAAGLAVTFGVLIHQKFGSVSSFIAQAKMTETRTPAPVDAPPSPPPAPPFDAARERAAEHAAAQMLYYARHARRIAADRLADYDQADALSKQADAAEQQGQHGVAVMYYQEAIAAAPQWGDLYEQMGWCLKHVGRLTDAEAAERQAARLNVNDAWAYYSVGDMLLEQRRGEDALPFYLTFVRLATHDLNLYMGYRRLAAIYDMLGGYTEALRADRGWIRSRPRDLDGLDDLGYSTQMTGDMAGSARICREVLRRRPDDVMATDNLGSAVWALGDHTGARRAWQRVLQLTATVTPTNALQRFGDISYYRQNAASFASDAQNMLDQHG